MKVNFKEGHLREIFRRFFRILNAAQPDPKNYLTDAEINLLAEFASLPPKYEFHRFSHIAKKKVQERLKEEAGWKVSMPSINAKIYSLIEKDILWRDEDSVIYFKKYLKQLIKTITQSVNSNQPYHILFTLSLEDDKTSSSQSQ